MKIKSLLHFTKHFKNDTICRKHLELTIWKGKPVCPHCNSEEPYRLADKKTFKCANSNCKRKFTVMTGTIFQGTILPLTTWFYAIYIMTSHKKGISSLQLSKDLGVTQKTAWFMLQRMRLMMNESNMELLSSFVEVDETYIGGKSGKGTQGRSTKFKTPVIGIIERHGRLIVQVVPDATSQTIDGMIGRHVDKNAIVITDSWRGYNNVKNQFTHWVIDHSKGEFVRGPVYTNTIEGFWSLLKRGLLGIYHWVGVKHLHRYCGEFEFRYNTKGFSEFDRFNFALTLSNKRLKYNNLVR